MRETAKMDRPLALTCGDPAGVGPEVIEAALEADLLKGRDCVLIGPRCWAEPLSEKVSADYHAVGPKDFEMRSGVPSEDGARVALAAMVAAAEGCRSGQYSGVVTGPVSKHWLCEVGFKHPGQTEFFANAWGGEPSMAFVGRELCVVLATWHLPLRDVPDALTRESLQLAVRRADALGKQLGKASPRIGVCGLNPHAGEGGILGMEETQILNPALAELRGEIPELSDCLPGDTVFFRQRQGDFDVVVGAYHDQALAAVKTLEFDAAVNVTLGLPYIRTSPDHGTAYHLAGKGLANPASFIAALDLARRLTRAVV